MIEPLLKAELEPVVRRQRRWLRGRILAKGWTILAVLAVTALALRRFAGISIPSAAVPVLGLLAAILLFHAWWRASRWEPDYRQIARRIEGQHPELHALLLTAVEQKRDPATGQFHFLQQRVVDDAIRESRAHDWMDAVSGKQLFLSRAAQLGSLAVLGIALINLGDQTASRLSGTAEKWAQTVTVTPGDVTIERGSGLVVMARFSGRVPAEVNLVMGSASNDQRRIPLTRTLADPVFGGSIPEVTANLIYYVEFAGNRSRSYNVTVFDYPALQRSDARIAFPEYTGLPEKRIQETRRVSAVEGSKLEFTLQLNKPVTTARFISKDQSTVVPLQAETNRPLAKLEDFPLLNSATFDLQLVDADGRTNKVPARFVLEALKNRKPELKIQSPHGDQRVSALEEVTFAAEAWDDFGLRDYGLSYTLAGQSPQVISLGQPAGPNEKRQMNHLLKLEDLGVRPDQLVSWFFWADDIGADGQVRRTSSDMYFAEVRPFEEIFREGQSPNEQAQSEEQGNQATKLAELQKQIINATWKLQRTETGPKPSAQYPKDATVVLESQEQALEQAQALGERASDPRAQTLIRNVEEAMEKAVQHLTKATNSTEPLPAALTSEQAAYQALLRLASHEYMVSRRRNQRGGQSAGSPSQQQLEQLDFKQEEDRYETQRQASPQQNAEQREQLQVLNRLKELAQRQQDLNQRIKELQTALQEAKTDEEREEIKRRLKRLREEEQEMLADIDELQQRMDRPENQSRMAEARQQLEKTRSEVQRAAEALENEAASQALASGTRAQQELQQLRDDFRKKNSSQFAEEMRQMRHEARDLAQKQEEIGQQLDSLVNEKRKTLSDLDKKQELAQRLEQQRSGVTNLLDHMRGVTEKAENVEPLLAKQLYDTLRESSQGNVDNALNMSQELLKRGFAQEATPFEQKARSDIDQLKRGVERAAESVLGDDVESLRLAKRELDSLTDELEREIAQKDPRAAQAEAQPGRTASQRGQQRQGSRASQPQSDSQRTGEQNSAQPAGAEQNQVGDERREAQQAGVGRDTNALARAGSQSSQQTERAQGQPGDRQNNQPGQQGQTGGRQNQDTEPQEGQQTAQAGQQGQGDQQQQPGQQEQAGQQANAGQQQGNQGQQGQGQQGQGQQGQGQQGQGQQGQPQQAQPGQQGQRGGRAQVATTAQGNTGEIGGRTLGRDSDQQDVTGRSLRRNFFDLNRTANNAEGGGNNPIGPLTGEDFVNWSDRLRDVEEMLDVDELRGEVARIRDRARAVRSEVKRHAKDPQWDMVRMEISGPLVEVRNRVAEELARREKADALVPIDRDPVPNKFSELVRRYYEKLGSE